MTALGTFLSSSQRFVNLVFWKNQTFPTTALNKQNCIIFEYTPVKNHANDSHLVLGLHENCRSIRSARSQIQTDKNPEMREEKRRKYWSRWCNEKGKRSESDSSRFLTEIPVTLFFFLWTMVYKWAGHMRGKAGNPKSIHSNHSDASYWPISTSMRIVNLATVWSSFDQNGQSVHYQHVLYVYVYSPVCLSVWMFQFIKQKSCGEWIRQWVICVINLREFYFFMSYRDLTMPHNLHTKFCSIINDRLREEALFSTNKLWEISTRLGNS